MRIAMLTGGGDCPGLNAVIRTIVRKAETQMGAETIGFYDSWDGVVEQRYALLKTNDVRGIAPRGGTILGTRRGGPFDKKSGVADVQRAVADLQLDALVVIGGNGSLTVASRLFEEHGLPTIGVPKTIDNDVVGTDSTFGFQTAVQIATDAIDRLHTTAESHDRILVVEVMGRDAGWIALHAGIAGGATAIVVPEDPFDIETLTEIVRRRHDNGRYASVVVVAEGATPRDKSQVDVYKGNVSAVIAQELQARTGYEARLVQLGHLQRGGTPTSYDRVLATRFGLAAVDACVNQEYGQMVVLRCGEIARASMKVTSGQTRTINLDLYRDIVASFVG
ncbi:MAG: 6-phosphofructokinase [Acidimicrobium sp. BACL17 MAG-120924-bin0]|jgi:ATP-dependent phosphofructokinase / diphosphate-dependent phosphofructokinase|nr:MAG: 6-phosphofructokinase [Acidimicrobium sp. BACL17 MAG-120924-bin0]